MGLITIIARGGEKSVLIHVTCSLYDICYLLIKFDINALS